MNPLLDFSGLPRFGEIQPEHVTPAVDQLLAENRALVERVATAAEPPTWDGFVAPIDDANERLSRAWGQVGHLNAVMNSPPLREVYNANLPRVTQYYTELAQDERLYAKFKALRAAGEYGRLGAAQRRIIDNELRDFWLSGAELAPERKARFKAIRARLDELSSRFNDNVLDATNAFGHIVTDAAQLAGIPADALEAARAAAQADGKEGWKFTLHMPSYLPVMQYADHRALRSHMYQAYVTRASELGKPQCDDTQWDNTPLIAEILKLRKEAAQLLDFESYAAFSLTPKMADSPIQVLDFLDDLAARVKPFAEREFEELTRFAATELGLPRLEAFDVGWAAEKLRLARYAFSEQEVKRYFPEDRVLPGMFRLVERLYGIRIAPAQAPVWHPDVRFFDIRRPDGELIGQFYLDLYARPSKRGGAWMDDAITRKRRADRIQTPVAYLNCNFSGPVGGRPALFTHSEVTTLFHEFGHGLHHLLTRVEHRGVSGIAGVEWDAVELPSQFMENFCWEWDVLQGMARHVDSGAPLPRELYDKMLAAKNFHSGMMFVRQLEFALFDMHLHHDFDPDGPMTALQLLDQVRRRVAVVIPPPYNRFPHSFSHIFAGGYAAGYYSYKWAEVLSADAYSLFEEQGVLNPEVGERFWREILGVGGSRPALESFVAFRGREPRIEALLRHSGMAVA
ncbi:MAG TPA: M3 family metallopeptidase [Burkholderiales bacterium]|nr:M3 family metallopeptidase [Burkholderiales bacterium]